MVRAAQALVLGDAQGGQDAVGQERQPAAGTEHPGRLGNPPLGIAPDAGPVLADHQVEARAGQRHMLGVGFDQREDQTEAILQLAFPLIEYRRRRRDNDGLHLLAEQ